MKYLSTNNHYILSILFIAILSTTLYGQTMQYGVRLGVSIPELRSQDDNIYSEDYTSVTGFDGSIFADFGITEKFSIKTELGYIRKGGERNGMQPIPTALVGDLSNFLAPGQVVWANFDNRAVFSYIEIPVLAKYELSLSDMLGVYINVGPYIDFMINPEQVTKGQSSFYFDEAGTMPVQIPANPQDPMQNWFFIDLPSQDLTAETDISEDLNSVDFGAMAGLGINANIGDQSKIFFDVRASYGFIPLQKDKDTYGKVHMANISLAVGYAYIFDKKGTSVPEN